MFFPASFAYIFILRIKVYHIYYYRHNQIFALTVLQAYFTLILIDMPNSFYWLHSAP